MSVAMTLGETLVGIAGLAVITVLSRSFFFLSQRELVLPAWVQRGLKFAPLAALAAVVVPEVVMTHGQLLHTWQDARLFAVAGATAWYVWRRSMLGTIVTGMAVYLPLHIGLGW